MIDLDSSEIINLILILSSVGGGGITIYFKKKLSLFVKFVQQIEEAMEDDKITNREMNNILKTGKALIGIETKKKE